MARYADIDALSRTIKLAWDTSDSEDFEKSVFVAIATAPTVEVVRRKECKYYQEGIDINGKPFSRCNGSIRTFGQTSPNWFCADGERREE